VSYRVVWDNRALNELENIRRASPDKEGIQQVVTRVDTQLTHKPLEAGESRYDNYRVLFKYPLVIWFEVVDRPYEVRVLHVRVTNR